MLGHLALQALCKWTAAGVSVACPQPRSRMDGNEGHMLVEMKGVDEEFDVSRR